MCTPRFSRHLRGSIAWVSSIGCKLALLVIPLFFCWTSSILANTVTVTDIGDTGTGTLRTMIAAANAGDTITFDASLNGDTILLTSGEIAINKNLTIIGNGRSNTTISGNNNSRIFNVGGIAFNVEALTISNGRAQVLDHGGAIYNTGTLTMTEASVLSSSTDFRPGGGIYNVNGTISLIRCILAGNVANKQDGATGDGGALCNIQGSITAINTVFSGNEGVNGQGGAIYSSEGAVTITNCSITGNKADQGGGVSTFQDNLTLTNTIIALNQATSSPDINITGSIVNAMHNWIGDGSGQTNIVDAVNGNRVGSSSNILDPGFNQNVSTIPSTEGDFRLSCGSLVLDLGTTSIAGLDLGATDVDGQPRIINRIVDIGAYELHLGDLVDPINLVTKTNNNGCGTLRFAINNTTAGDTVKFDDAINGQKHFLFEKLEPRKDLVIQGNGKFNTIIDGSGTIQVLVNEDKLTLLSLTIQNGNAFQGGGVKNSGELYTRLCNFNDNRAFSGGGAIYSTGLLDLQYTKFYNNNGSNTGGAISINDSLLLMDHCVITENRARSGAGIETRGSIVDVAHTTIFKNSGMGGSGMGLFEDSKLTLHNSIIAENSGISPTSDLSIFSGSTIIAAANNLVGDGSILTDGVDGNIVGTSTNKIAPQLNNTIAISSDAYLQPLPCSPVINKGSSSTQLLDFNQLPRVVNGQLDIGAHEYQGTLDREVTSTLNDGIGSLRQIQDEACMGDTITFSPTLDGDTIRLTDQITLGKDLDIQGNGMYETIISGENVGRVFTIVQNSEVSILDLQIVNGIANQGGGVLNQGELSLTRVGLMGNNSVNEGGGLFNSALSSNCTLIECKVLENTAKNSGGGIFNQGIMRIEKSNIDINTVGDPTVVNALGGGIFCDEKIEVYNSSIVGNIAGVEQNNNDMPVNSGGGIYLLDSSLLSNVTIAGNKCFGPGSDGGGMFASGSLDLINTIITGNTSAMEPQLSYAGSMLLFAHSWVSDVDPLFIVSPSPGNRGDIRLQCNSPVINIGANIVSDINQQIVDIGATDIFNQTRIANTIVDIGAFEYQDDLQIDNLLLTDLSSSTDFLAAETISASGDIIAPRMLNFRAEHSVNLDPQFSVSSGAGLTVQIGGCSN